MTETITEELISICVELASSEKKPTSALLKYKYKKPVPFKLLVDVIQYWNKLEETEKQAKIEKFRKNIKIDNTINNISSNSIKEDPVHSMLSDEVFLKLQNDEKFLYLKHLFESLKK